MKDHPEIVITMTEADYYFLVFILGQLTGKAIQDHNKADSQRINDLFHNIQATAVTKKSDGPQS